MIDKPFDPTDTPLPLDFYGRKYLLSRTTLWRYEKAGLPVLRVGGKCFIRESAFVAFLEMMNGKTASAIPLKPAPEGGK